MPAKEMQKQARKRVFFICYRHEDSMLQSLQLGKSLKRIFGGDKVFIDLLDLEPGTRWSPEIESRISSAHALLVVIGPRWMDPRPDGREDEVCREIEVAVRDNVEMVPILLTPAVMPPENTIPERIRKVHEYQAQRLDVVGHYEEDVDKLARYLARKHDVRRRRKEWRLVLTIAFCAIILAIGLWLAMPWVKQPNYPSALTQDLFDSGRYMEAHEAVDRWRLEEPNNKSAEFLQSRIEEILAGLQTFDRSLQAKNYAAARGAFDRICELNKADPNTEIRRAKLNETFAPHFQDEFLGTLDSWVFPERWIVNQGSLIVRGIGLGFLKEKHYADFTATFNISFLNYRGAVWIVRAETRPSRYYMFQLTGPKGNPESSFTAYRFFGDKKETVLGPLSVGANLGIEGDQFTVEVQATGSKIENYISLVSDPAEKHRLLGQLIDPMIREGTIGFGTKDGEEFSVRAFKIIPAGEK